MLDRLTPNSKSSPNKSNSKFR